jgi:hypothetical protein
MTELAALSKTPHALADGLMLVFQHPAKARGWKLRADSPHRSLNQF